MDGAMARNQEGFIADKWNAHIPDTRGGDFLGREKAKHISVEMQEKKFSGQMFSLRFWIKKTWQW